MYHVVRVGWGEVDSSANLEELLNEEAEAGFHLDQVVPVTYLVEQNVGEEPEDILELIVITSDAL